MSDDDARALTAFLMSLKGGNKRRLPRNEPLFSAIFLLSLALVTTYCVHKSESAQALKPTASGAAIVESSGGKQLASTGMLLPQPVVVQVNDEKGTAVVGALVEFSAASGVTFDPRNLR